MTQLEEEEEGEQEEEEKGTRSYQHFHSLHHCAPPILLQLLPPLPSAHQEEVSKEVSGKHLVEAVAGLTIRPPQCLSPCAELVVQVTVVAIRNREWSVDCTQPHPLVPLPGCGWAHCSPVHPCHWHDASVEEQPVHMPVPVVEWEWDMCAWDEVMQAHTSSVVQWQL